MRWRKTKAVPLCRTADSCEVSSPASRVLSTQVAILFGGPVCWRDVSLDRRLVTLRGETAKTGAEQLVSISDDTAGLLESMRRSPADLVWPYPWERRRLWLDLHGILGAAEIDGRSIGFHRIRKTHATQVVALLGWDAARVALGHSDETMTRRYVDLRQIPRQEIALPRPKAR